MKEAVEAELARLAAMEAQLIEGLKAQQAEQALALEALEAELGTSRCDARQKRAAGLAWHACICVMQQQCSRECNVVLASA